MCRFLKIQSLDILHAMGRPGAEVSGRPKGSVMTATFKIDGRGILSFKRGTTFKFSEAISLMVNCETQRNRRGVAEALLRARRRTMRLAERINGCPGKLFLLVERCYGIKTQNRRGGAGYSSDDQSRTLNNQEAFERGSPAEALTSRQPYRLRSHRSTNRQRTDEPRK